MENFSLRFHLRAFLNRKKSIWPSTPLLRLINFTRFNRILKSTYFLFLYEILMQMFLPLVLLIEINFEDFDEFPLLSNTIGWLNESQE